MSSRERRPIRSAAPTFEPVTLEQAKTQVRISIENIDHDDYLNRLIAQAREQFENDTSVICATGTFTLKLDCFDDDDIDLPLRPVTAISSITYKDSDGTTQTFSSSKYALSTSGAMPEIVLAYNEVWPSVRGHRDDVTITFVAGYATAADVPEMVKQAILLEVKNQFESEDVSKMSENFGYTMLSRRFERPTYP